MFSPDETTLFNYESRRVLEFPFDVIESHRGMFADSFCKWLKSNLHVFSAFVTQAKYVRNVMRRDHYSARTIGEWLRHNSAVKEHGNGWKLNNDWFPALARLSMLAYPELAGLFETREKNT